MLFSWNDRVEPPLDLLSIIIIIIIIIKNECHSNIIVDRLQGCRQMKANVEDVMTGCCTA